MAFSDAPPPATGCHSAEGVKKILISDWPGHFLVVCWDDPEIHLTSAPRAGHSQDFWTANLWPDGTLHFRSSLGNRQATKRAVAALLIQLPRKYEHLLIEVRPGPTVAAEDALVS